MAKTKLRAYGAFTGTPYGSFAGKKSRLRLTQLRSFGAFTGGRYGSFAGRPAQPIPPIGPVIPAVMNPADGGARVPKRHTLGRGDVEYYPEDRRVEKRKRREEMAILLGKGFL